MKDGQWSINICLNVALEICSLKMPPCFVCYYDRVNKNIKQSQFIHYEKNYRERGSKVPAQPVKFSVNPV